MRDGPGALQKYWNDTELMTKVRVQRTSGDDTGHEPGQNKWESWHVLQSRPDRKADNYQCKEKKAPAMLWT